MASEKGAPSLAQTTPLRALHEALGARFVPFGGYEMPLQYEGILSEHEAVRSGCGIFDVSHMGNLDVPLDDAGRVSHTIAANVAKIPPGRGKYTLCLNADGTILDDIIVFRLPDKLHVVPNAGMHTAISRRLSDSGCRVTDATTTTCILAVQGPQAPALVAKALGDGHIVKRFRAQPLPDGQGFVAGTGYTGEEGVEFFVAVPRAREIFDALVKAGAQPCGLGARDTLRLEKGYCLAGNEFHPAVTPVEAGLLWTCDLDHDFVGRETVDRRVATGPAERLVGIRLTDKGIPRRDCEVFAGDRRVGRVSSGTMSPTLGVGIALAYVASALSKPSTAVEVDVRGRRLSGRVVEVPFL